MGRWDGIHFVEVGEERIRMEDLGKREENVKTRPAQWTRENNEGFRGNRTLDLLFTRQAL